MIGRKRSGVFLSYSRSDGEEFAKALRRRLSESAPDIRIMRDREILEGGEGWRNQIKDAIESVEFVVLVMTPAGIRSAEVQFEWRFAREQGVCIYPVKAAPDSELQFSQLPRWMSKAHFFDIEKEWETFLAHLRKGCDTPRVLFMAPELPDSSVKRPVELGRVKNLLFNTNGTVALLGGGGFGKTTLANALCHELDIIQNFDDGVLWVELGRNPDVLRSLANIYASLTGERPGFVSEDDAAFHVGRKLEGRDCLLVIDNVWGDMHLRPFLRGGKGCRRLFTTQNAEIASAFQPVNVNEMRESESLELIANFVPDLPRSFAVKLSRKLGEYPLILDLAGARMRERIKQGDSAERAAERLLEKLIREGPRGLSRGTGDPRHRSLDAVMEYSLEGRGNDDRRRLEEISIFPEDVDIPLSAAAALWRQEEAGAEETALGFARLSLLKLDLGRGEMRLHDVIRSWLATAIPNAAELHLRLVSAWPDWMQLPYAYAWRLLAWHLAQAGQTAELYRLARNEKFLSLQERTLQDEPYAALATVGIALQHALDNDDAIGSADFVLRRADRFERVSTQSPLKVLRAGERARAFGLAAGFETGRRILWYLLLAWESKAGNRAADLRMAVQYLEEVGPLPKLITRQTKLAADLMVEALDIHSELFLALRKQSLTTTGLPDLCASLVRHGEIALAGEIAPDIENPCKRARVWLQIASHQSGLGQHDLARDSFTAAITTARQTTDSEEDYDSVAGNSEYDPEDYECGRWDQERTLQDIAAAQVRTGDAVAALATVAGDPEGSNLTRVLIAQGQAQRGDWTSAKATLEQIQSPYERVRTLCLLAVARSEAGMREPASEMIREAIGETREVKNRSQRDACRLAIKSARARMGDVKPLPKAQRTRRGAAKHVGFTSASAAMDAPRENVRALQEMALEQAGRGLSDLARASLASAIELARNDQYDAYLAETLQSIARLQVQIGDTEAARATYALAVFESRGYDAGGWDLDKGLAEVAIAHAERGDFEAALNTLLSLSPGTVERSEAMIDVAAAQARQGRLDEAIDTALHNEGWWRAKALRKVAAVSRRDADPVKLFAILLTAYEVSLRIPKASIRGMAMALTGSELVAAGRKESGLQILAEAADVASTVGFANEGDSDTTEDGQELFRQIAPLQAQAGDFDAALATVNQLYDPDLLRAALDDIERIRKSAAQEDAASVHEQPEAAPVTQTPDIARQRLKEEAARGVRLRDAAIQFCGELARQFPNDAADIEELMRKFAGWLRGKEDSESIRRA